MNFIDCSDTVCGKAQNDSSIPLEPACRRSRSAKGMKPKWLTQDILLGVAIDMWTGDIGARIGIALGLMRRG